MTYDARFWFAVVLYLVGAAFAAIGIRQWVEAHLLNEKEKPQ